MPMPARSRRPQRAQDRKAEVAFNLPPFEDAIAQHVLANGRCHGEEKTANDACDHNQAKIRTDRSEGYLRRPNYAVAVLERRIRNRELDPRPVGPLQDALELVQLKPQTNAGEVRHVAAAWRIASGYRRIRNRPRC